MHSFSAVDKPCISLIQMCPKQPTPTVTSKMLKPASSRSETKGPYRAHFLPGIYSFKMIFIVDNHRHFHKDDSYYYL